MKIVVFELEPRNAAPFEALGVTHDLVRLDEPLRAVNADAFADADIVSTFIDSEMDGGVLRKLPALRMIATRSTGFDHIDTAYCGERGIVVSNVPAYGETTVAEHVFALLLAVSHRLPEAIERARHGSFSSKGLQGFDLAGKTLGVIGTGSIGRRVIRIARAFAMNVVAFDAGPVADLPAELGFRYLALDDVLAVADVVTLHVPSLPETRHLLSAAAFRRMKPGVVVINTARGDLIESAALIEALASGKVAAAGLDVLPDEAAIREEAETISSILHDRGDLSELVTDHVLLRMPHVIVTPHSGFNTREAVDRIIESTVANIGAFLAGRPQNLVPAGAFADRRTFAEGRRCVAGEFARINGVPS